MQIVIEISDYDKEWVTNGVYIPDEINRKIAEAIINGIPLPEGHGAIKDVSQIEIPMCEDRSYERWVQVAINSAPTIIEADKTEE